MTINISRMKLQEFAFDCTAFQTTEPIYSTAQFEDQRYAARIPIGTRTLTHIEFSVHESEWNMVMASVGELVHYTISSNESYYATVKDTRYQISNGTRRYSVTLTSHP